jgi:radical SAM protein with 4Fe4S-binding SPASM domain
MCFFWGEHGVYKNSKQRIKPKVMDLELAKKLINEMDLAKPKPWYSLFGGEPLIYSYLEELCLSLKEKGNFFEITTNGTLIKKLAPMLIRTGVGQVKISIDGPKNINDSQRGVGSYDKAIEGMKILHQEKLETGSKTPYISIIYTITPENYNYIEEFFLNNKDLDLSALNYVGFDMQNFITQEMGLAYAKWLKSEFGMQNSEYWKGFVQPLCDFEKMDIEELVSQLNKVLGYLEQNNVNNHCIPPTISTKNLSAYFKADWKNMEDLYEKCQMPWISVDITASGDVAPCHTIYDLRMGNLHEKSFKEIWFSEKYQKLRDYISQYKFTPFCNIGCVGLYLGGQKKSKVKEVSH